MKRFLALSAAAALCACGGAGDERLDADDVPSAARTSDGQTVPGYGGNDVVDGQGADGDTAPRIPRPRNAVAANAMQEMTFDVLNSSGRSIGTVTIADRSGGVDVELDVTSIPAGEHALHFHEVGTCDGPDFTSAGGHYNPSGHNHGFEASAPNPHAGDMRNFTAPQSGVVKVTVDNDRVSLGARDGLAPLMDANGSALIIHAGADDYESQPSGDAGGRIACAVIAG